MCFYWMMASNIAGSIAISIWCSSARWSRSVMATCSQEDCFANRSAGSIVRMPWSSPMPIKWTIDVAGRDRASDSPIHPDAPIYRAIHAEAGVLSSDAGSDPMPVSQLSHAVSSPSADWPIQLRWIAGSNPSAGLCWPTVVRRSSSIRTRGCEEPHTRGTGPRSRLAAHHRKRLGQDRAAGVRFPDLAPGDPHAVPGRQ